MGLYQDLQAYSSSWSRAGLSSSNLHRRYPADGRVEEDGPGTGFDPDIPATVSGIRDKHRQDGDRTSPSTGIPKLQGRLFTDGYEPPK